MDRTIKVTGTGSLSVKPDTTVLHIQLQGSEKKYEAACAKAAEAGAQIGRAFAALGFAEDELKTVSFSVNTRQEGYTDKNGVYRTRQAGYEFYQELKLSFAADNERLSQCLTVLAKAECSPLFHIEYTVKNPESAKNRLLALAVKDSEKKAKILAKAAGKTLGDVLFMDYSWGQMNLSVRPMMNFAREKSMAMCEDAIAVNVTPEDIRIEDTVTVLWELK